MSDGARHASGLMGGKVLTIVPLAIAAMVGGAFYWGLLNSDDRLPSTLIGRLAPDFALPPIEGRNDGLSSEDLRGEVTIVNVWASWCVPCRLEMPMLVKLAETGTVPIYGINYKDEPAEALKFLAELGDPYNRIGADRNGRASIEWGVYGLPETFVIDGDGQITYKHVGPFDRQVLEEKILPIVRRLQAEHRS